MAGFFLKVFYFLQSYYVILKLEIKLYANIKNLIIN